MKNILAEIITIGDEILFGQIVDTNSQWISNLLDKNGIRVVRKSSIGDSENEILDILKEAKERVDIVLMTGGLGPTSDDITKKTLAKYFNTELILNLEALEDVTSFFNKRGRELTEINKLQAFIPENSICIRNKRGTAPGMWFKKDDKIFVSMPGVPFEMKAMMEESIIPKIKDEFKTPFIYHKVIHTVGIGESYLAEKIKEWESKLPIHIKLAYLPSFSEVKLRLTSSGEALETIKKDIDDQVTSLKFLISDYIYGYDEDTLPEVIGKKLLEDNLTIVTAESCTGGYLSHLITSIAGSSNYYKGSIIAYHNETKNEILGVQEATLKAHGAVSEQTVKEMAENVREKLKADIGVSTSGIAGPGGGTEEKPVGTVWIAYSDLNQTVTKKLMLGHDREINIKLTSIALLNLIRQSLPKKS